jgi:hypothetical protein
MTVPAFASGRAGGSAPSKIIVPSTGGASRVAISGAGPRLRAWSTRGVYQGPAAEPEGRSVEPTPIRHRDAAADNTMATGCVANMIEKPFGNSYGCREWRYFGFTAFA